MPGFDGTGPDFEGPMTGGARGYCAGDAPFAGRPMGYGRGFGYGRGRRGRAAAPAGGRGRARAMGADPWRPSGDAALAALEQQAARLQQSLDAVCRQIDSLKADPATSGRPETPGEA